MFYHIKGLCPRPSDVSGCGFCIDLWPAFKEAVAKCNLNQQLVDNGINSLHRGWLDGCGFDQIVDPDEDPLERWKAKNGLEHKKPGPNAYKLYDRHSIRVQWGEWGPEHITVPGNACGLDLDTHTVCGPRGGVSLLPHNIDTIRQAHLCLVVFAWFADSIILRSTVKGG